VPPDLSLCPDRSRNCAAPLALSLPGRSRALFLHGARPAALQPPPPPPRDHDLCPILLLLLLARPPAAPRGICILTHCALASLSAASPCDSHILITNGHETSPCRGRHVPFLIPSFKPDIYSATPPERCPRVNARGGLARVAVKGSSLLSAALYGICNGERGRWMYVIRHSTEIMEFR